ncbi:MAG: nickel pincer cofactor biosynthesis protein LarC, partial [Methanobacteriaceae archaeon]
IDNISSDLFTDSIKECSKRVFNHIATAEAKVHGKTPNNVHFHEVGAADAVADVIGSVYAYYQLSFNKEKVFGLPVALGGGAIETAHGRLPIPAPATLNILEGIQCFGGPITGELATPTGVALFKEFCNGFTEFMPMIKPVTIAYGAGKKNFDFPNVLRIIKGESTIESDKIAILETNLDHLTGEELGHLFEVLMNEGALDVSLTPTIMKKNRPGQILKVIAKSSNQEHVLNTIFKETGTLGIRVLPNAHRSILNRKIIKINVDFSEIADTDNNLKDSIAELRFKVAMLGNKVISARVEYDDISKIAKIINVPLKKVNKVAEAAINDYLGLK